VSCPALRMPSVVAPGISGACSLHTL
jgi:hypothetical protein